MFASYIATALIVAGSALAANDSTSTSAETSSKVVLTDFLGEEGPTAIPGRSAGIAIIGDHTYTAGGPVVTSRGDTINAILTDGVVFNDQTYTYTTTDTRTTLPFNGYTFMYSHEGNGSLVMGTGETLTPGDPALVTAGHTISVATEGVYIDGTLSLTSTSTRLQTVTMETETLTATEILSGIFALYTDTLTAGGSAKTVRGQEVTAAPTGLVVAAPSSSSSASASTTSSTSGASKLATGCWAGLVACGLLFCLL